MPLNCPRCNWYIRSINKECWLYECSNPLCNAVLQLPEKNQRRKLK
jgi:hypothetical protein